MSRHGDGRKARIADSFGVAGDYERHAEVQALIARSLAAMLPSGLFGPDEGGPTTDPASGEPHIFPETVQSPALDSHGAPARAPALGGSQRPPIAGSRGLSPLAGRVREGEEPSRSGESRGGAAPFGRESPERAGALSGRRRRLGAPPLVLEVGCGTGLLGRALAGRLPASSRILFTDISPGMVRRARSRLADAFPAAGFAVMDAEAPAARPVFDLVASSMALQWTSDLGATLRGLADLLKPGGRMLVGLPGRESFARWRAACLRLGLPYGGPVLPAAEELAALHPTEGATEVRQERLRVRHADARAFFRSLKAIGAGVPAQGYAPLDAADFRRLLRAMDEESAGEPFEMEYQALYALHVKPDRVGEAEEKS